MSDISLQLDEAFEKYIEAMVTCNVAKDKVASLLQQNMGVECGKSHELAKAMCDAAYKKAVEEEI